MNTKAVIAVLGFLLVECTAASTWAQSIVATSKVANAKFISEKIVIDGRLTEPAWQGAEANDGFIQREPEEGKPASERTEVRLLYTTEMLYIGVVCHDKTPDKILVNDIRKDFNQGEQDSFGIILDTFLDRRNGYYFMTTPVGGQRDSQFFNEGRINTESWDGVWYVESRRTEDGYVIEIGIPFRTLRFKRVHQQQWGAQFFRGIRRNQEWNYWAPLPRRMNASSGVSLAGTVTGIENVTPGRNLQIKPYGVAGMKRIGAGSDSKADLNAGLDLKYGVTPGLILDLTANTDFSHVEADPQQVNLTRFPLFFEEKREFFLENAGIFQFGSLTSSEALLFHSRTIGLQDGKTIPILGGARLTGRAGRNYIGLLNMQTRPEESFAATNFSVARLRRDILGNSDVGLIFLNKRSSLPQDHNRSYGADANFAFLNTTLKFNGLLARTETPGRTGSDEIAKLDGEYGDNLVRVQGSYLQVGENFNPEMGFVRERGRRIFHQEFEFKPRLRPETPVGSFLRDIIFQMTSEYALFLNQQTHSKLYRPQLNFQFRDGSNFLIQYTQNFDRPTESFRLPFSVTVPAGDYRFNTVNVTFNSNRSKPVSGNAGFNTGDFYGGTRLETKLGAVFRPNYKFSSTVDYTRNKVRLPQGDFATNLIGARIDYSFNPKMFLNTFIQYNSETRKVSSNIRFRLVHRPLSDIYLVYNEARDRAGSGTDWSVALKYTHLLNF